MAWSERQQAMLAEMGLRLWLPPAAAGDAPVAAAAAVEVMPGDAAAPISRHSPPEPPDAPVTREPAPGASQVSGLDWPALRAAVAGCQACGLCQSRRQTVFGVGHPQARLMIVGEAPGEQEDAQGEPFVGAAGQLLDRMLAALGMGRMDSPPPRPGGARAGASPVRAGDPERQVFIANTLKCRPPRNRNPAPEELAACRPFLDRQLTLVQPRVILAMGRFAVQQLLGTDAAIGQLRGRVHRWQGVPVVVSYHPAYLLRQPADKAKAWDDLCRVAELLQLPAG